MNDENYDLEKIYKELEILDDETKEETEEYNEMKQRTLNSEIQNHEFKVISINQEIETETAIKAYPALSILKLNNQEIETETAIKAYPALSILKLNNQENETETAIDADPDPIELKTLLGAKENETETAIDADPDPIELKTLLGSILKLNNQENETETAIDADPDPIELKTLLGAKENETETVIDADPDPIELKTLLGSILCDSNNKAQIEKHQMILKVLYDEIALLKALYDQIAGAAHIEAHDETVSRDSNNEAQIEKHQIILKTLYDQITVLKALYDQIAGVARTEAHDDTISRDSNNEPQIRMHQTILKVLYDKIAVLKALYDQIAGVAHTNNEAQIGMNHMILRLHPWHLTQLLEIVHSTVSVSCIQSLRCRKLGCLLDTDICIESLLGSLHIATTLALLHVQNKCHAFREFKILGVVTWISWHINGVILQNQSNNSSGIVLELKSEVSSHGIGTIFVGLTGAFLNINNGINMQVIDTSLIIVAWHYVTTVNLAYFTSNIKHASVYNEEHQRFFNKVMHSLISPNGNVTIKLIDSTACILLKELSINPIFNTKLYNGSYPLQNGHKYKVLCSLSLKQNGNDCINKKAVSLAIKEWNKDNEIFHISYYNIAMCLYHRTHFNKLLITTLITCNELIQSIAFNKTMNEQIIKLNKKTKIMDHHKICGGSKEILVQILEMDTLSYYRAIYLLDCHSIWNTLNMILQKAQYLLLSSNKIKKVKSNDCYIDDFGTNKDDTMSLYLCLSRILYPQIYDEFYIYNDNEDPDQDTENDAKYGLSYYIDENEAKCGQKPPDPTLDPPEENEGQGIKDLDSAINVLEIAKIEQEKILTNAAETDKECTVEEATNDNIADAFKVFSIDQEIETETEEQYVNVDPNEYRGLLITCLYPQIYDEYYIYNGNGGVLCCDIKAMIRQYIDNNNLWDNDFHCNRLVDLYHVDIVLNVIKESIQKDPTRDIAQNGYNDQPLSSNKISSITRTNNRQCNDINKAYIARCNESHVLYHNLCDEHSYHICCNLNTMIVNIPSTSMFSTNDTLLYNGELYYVAEHHLMYFGGKQSIFDDYDDISSDIWYYDLNERLSVYKHPKEISCYVFGKDKIQQTFDIFDRTKTGYVSISDIKDTIYHLEFGVNVSDNSLDYMFRLCDTMDDGQTSLQEFQKWFKRDINGTKAPTHDDAKLFDVIYDLEIIIRYLLMPKATQYIPISDHIIKAKHNTNHNEDQDIDIEQFINNENDDDSNTEQQPQIRRTALDLNWSNEDECIEEYESEQNNDKITWFPPQNDHEVKEEEERVIKYDESAYNVLFELHTEWPSLSFDIVSDNLGAVRTSIPYSLYLITGIQSDLNLSKEMKHEMHPTNQQPLLRTTSTQTTSVQHHNTACHAPNQCNINKYIKVDEYLQDLNDDSDDIETSKYEDDLDAKYSQKLKVAVTKLKQYKALNRRQKKEINTANKYENHERQKHYQSISDLNLDKLSKQVIPLKETNDELEAIKAFDAKFHSVDAVTILKEYENGQTLNWQLSFNTKFECISLLNNVRRVDVSSISLIRSGGNKSVSHIVPVLGGYMYNIMIDGEKKLSTISPLNVVSLYEKNKYKLIIKHKKGKPTPLISECIVNVCSNYMPMNEMSEIKNTGLQNLERMVNKSSSYNDRLIEENTITNCDLSENSNFELVCENPIDNGCLFIIDSMVNGDIMINGENSTPLPFDIDTVSRLHTFKSFQTAESSLLDHEDEFDPPWPSLRLNKDKGRIDNDNHDECGCDINSDHDVSSFQYVNDMIYHSDDLRLDSNRAKDDLKLMRDRSRSLSVSNIEVSTIFDEPLNETLSTMSTISIESLQIHEYKDIVDDVLSEDDISDFQPRFTSYLRKWEGIQCIEQHVDDADGRLPSTDVLSTVISNQSFDPPSNPIKIIQLIHIDNGCLFIIDFMVNGDIMVICNEINEELYEFQSVAAKKVALTLLIAENREVLMNNILGNLNLSSDTINKIDIEDHVSVELNAENDNNGNNDEIYEIESNSDENLSSDFMSLKPSTPPSDIINKNNNYTMYNPSNVPLRIIRSASKELKLMNNILGANDIDNVLDNLLDNKRRISKLSLLNKDVKCTSDIVSDINAESTTNVRNKVNKADKEEINILNFASIDASIDDVSSVLDILDMNKERIRIVSNRSFGNGSLLIQECTNII